MAKLFDVLNLDPGAIAGMLAEEKANPTLRDLAEQVRRAVLDGLERDDNSFAVATCRALVIQKGVAEALEHFDLITTLDAIRVLGQTPRQENIGYA